MAKNHALVYIFIVVIGIFGFRVMKLVGGPLLQKKTSSTKTPTIAIANPSVTPGNLLPIPIADGETEYTIGKLWALIKTNNQSSQFLILMTDTHGNPIGSQSTTTAGLTGVINKNLNTSVTLQPDTALGQKLVSLGHLASIDLANYLKILVYFELGGQHFYLADPFPGVIRSYVTMSIGRPVVNVTNPAQLNMQKWNYTKTYQP